MPELDSKRLQIIAFIDALLANWETILTLLSDSKPSLVKELQLRLQKAATTLAPLESSGYLEPNPRMTVAEIFVPIDLRDLFFQTRAKDYVCELFDRHFDPRIYRRYREAKLDATFSPTDLQKQTESVKILQSLTKDVVNDLASVSAQPAVALDSDFESVPVFFATNRSYINQKERPVYTGEPSTLSFGVAHVTIPLSRHRVGRVERPMWWSLNKRDPNRYVIVGEIESLGQSEFCARLTQAAADIKPKQGLLIFIHGYKVSFEEAARAAAQLARDLQFKGAIVLFSWPSVGTFTGYRPDEDRSSASGERLAEFIEILNGGPWTNVHVLGHSMGCRVIVSGLADNEIRTPMGQVVLVAADVYVHQFQAKVPKMLTRGQQRTSYVSRQDKALKLSALLHKGDRIGLPKSTPFLASGWQIVDATYVSTGLVRHSYFSRERSVITDLEYLLCHGLSAADRRGLSQHSSRKYWYFPK